MTDDDLLEAARTKLGPKATVRISQSPRGGVIVHVGVGAGKMPHVMVWERTAGEAVDVAMAAVDRMVGAR